MPRDMSRIKHEQPGPQHVVVPREQERQHQQDNDDYHGQKGRAALPDFRRFPHRLGRPDATAIADDRLVGDLGSAVTTNHGY